MRWQVVEGSMLQVDPYSIVAPRAKAVIVRESMRRKGSALLRGRSPETGHLLDNEGGAGEDALIAAARARAAEEARITEELAENDTRMRARAAAIVSQRERDKQQAAEGAAAAGKVT